MPPEGGLQTNPPNQPAANTLPAGHVEKFPAYCCANAALNAELAGQSHKVWVSPPANSRIAGTTEDKNRLRSGKNSPSCPATGCDTASADVEAYTPYTIQPTTAAMIEGEGQHRKNGDDSRRRGRTGSGRGLDSIIAASMPGSRSGGRIRDHRWSIQILKPSPTIWYDSTTFLRAAHARGTCCTFTSATMLGGDCAVGGQDTR